MTSLPSSVKSKFQLHDPFLQDEEKAIMQKHTEFNNAASIPFFAEVLEKSTVVTADQKNAINEGKVQAWFDAMSSLDPPTNAPDPVVQAGLQRGSETLTQLQNGYAAQMDDLYKYYYRLKVADFDQYCSDQATAQKWFENLKIYVESDEFVAQWVSLVRFLFTAP